MNPKIDKFHHDNHSKLVRKFYLKVMLQNQWVFNSDGSLTDDASQACKFLFIDAETLKFR